MGSSISPAEKASRLARFVLLAGIAVVTALIIANPESRQAVNPLRVGTAQANGGICSAPNYLALTVGASNEDKFYVIDTNKKVICVYRIETAQIRLVCARKFDEDEKIWDPSIPLLRNNKPLEGSDGVTRDDSKYYAEQLQKFLESGKKKP
jgi:hypothetical protein